MGDLQKIAELATRELGGGRSSNLQHVSSNNQQKQMTTINPPKITTSTLNMEMPHQQHQSSSHNQQQQQQNGKFHGQNHPETTTMTITTTTTLTTSGSSPSPSPGQDKEHKRIVRLEKNRQSAALSRQRKKEVRRKHLNHLYSFENKIFQLIFFRNLQLKFSTFSKKKKLSSTLKFASCHV